MTEKPTNPFARLDTNLLRSTRSPEIPESVAPEEPAEAASTIVALPAKPRASKNARLPDNTRASKQSRNQASKQASVLALQPEDLIQAIRHVVKRPGKEVSYVRLTPQEKAQLADIVYTFKRQGKKTSETEINRIAVNFMIEDYRMNGENSVLAQVLDALQA
jgi:hypothetical protein